jgi:hypothetical protein
MFFLLYFSVISICYSKNKIKKSECAKNIEINYYKKNGKVLIIGQDYLLCTLENDSIVIKVLFNKCNIIYWAISSKNKEECPRSFAKYYNDKLVTFDSTDLNCNRIIQYIADTNFGDSGILPKYLLKDVK